MSTRKTKTATSLEGMTQCGSHIGSSVILGKAGYLHCESILFLGGFSIHGKREVLVPGLGTCSSELVQSTESRGLGDSSARGCRSNGG